MMKKTAISLFVLLTLTGCVYDQYTPEDCQQKQRYYMSFALKSPGQATKATLDGGFDSQTVAEHLVGKVDLYFYDGAGKYLEHRVASYDNALAPSPDVTLDFEDQSMQDGSVAVGGYAKFTVALDHRPYKMLLLVNQPYTMMDKSLSEAKALVKAGADYKGGVAIPIKYTSPTGVETTENVDPMFMASASYLNAYGSPVTEVNIAEFYLRETEEEAKTVPIDVYVERMAAKVTVKAGQTEYTVPVVTAQENLSAKVTLLSWGLNGLNLKSYHFKKVDPFWNFSWKWNNFEAKRSYWGEDPNYTASQAVELSQQKSAVDSDPFKFLKPAELDAAFDTPLYCMENTASGDALPVTDSDAATLYSRITHVIVPAKLSFSLTGGTDDYGYTAPGADFFRYKGVIYTKASLLKALRQDAGLTVADDNDLELVSAADQTYCKGYDRGERVAVKYNGAVLPLEEGGQPVRIDGFKGGAFYYKIPIEHINNEDVTAATYPVGRYGVVRNHNYTVTLGELEGIGTGIWDADYDIRPFRKPGEYIVSANVKVTPWIEFVQNFMFVDPSGMLVTMGQAVEESDADTEWWE